MPLKTRLIKNKRLRQTINYGSIVLCLIALIVTNPFVPVKITPPQLVTEPVVKTDPFADLHLEAKAVLVYDPNNDHILFERRPNDVLPLASITKVMTALVVSEHLKPTIVVTVPETATDTADNLIPGEKWRVKDLVDYTLVRSSNIGAVTLGSNLRTLAGLDPVATMNAKARELGMTKTVYYNTTGLDLSASKAGAYGSAHDVATLFSYLLEHQPALLAATSNKYEHKISSSLVSHLAVNTNQLVATIPGLIASKTGLTELAEGNLAITFDAGLQQPIIIVVLGSSADGRFEDVKSLIAATYQAIQNTVY